MTSLEWLLADATDECHEAVERSRLLIAISLQKIRRTQARLKWASDPHGPVALPPHLMSDPWPDSGPDRACFPRRQPTTDRRD